MAAGTGTVEAPYGSAEDLGEGILRVTAPNPSPMTHSGTRCYLVGDAEEAVLIDPGPADARHRAALLAALGRRRLVAILVTHSHLDHSPGAPALTRETGAPVFAFGPHGAGTGAQMRALAAGPGGAALGGGEGADAGFMPDRRLADGEAVAVGDRQIIALHTPGHLSNHLSFRIENSGTIFSGDAVMGWSTTLVSPPEGDMAAQVATLGRLEALVAEMAAGGQRPRFLPGHGPPVAAPAELLATHIAHRRARRAALIAALADGPANARVFAERLYTQTPPALMGAAARNVLATLLQLAAEGVAEPCGPLSAAVAFRLTGAS
ncbi:MAG: MBL fold metallo-hydrolase [Pseudomonadota bacterium]